MALHLAGQGNHRALITLVETWAEFAVPTVPARLAEARSFVSLRMVDRAWVRLKDLVECAEPNVEALQIAAQMFLLRGWQNQARKVVQLGLERVPGDPLLEALAVQAAEAPPPIDDVVDENAVSAELVRVAEQHMARGAFVRARTLLERVRRRDPGHQRTGELLWAIRGEFASTESLASMCERWAPTTPTGAPEGFEEPEHTVTVRVDDIRPAAEDRSFPQLFRNLGIPARRALPDDDDEGETGATPEVTAVRALADTGELDQSFTDRTDYGEDTQIARVMRKGGILQGIDVPGQGGRSGEGGLNLADFRELDPISDLRGPEDEDDSVVIRIGGESEPETSEAGHDLSLDTRDERLAKAKQGSAGEEAWAAAPTEVRPRILGRPAAKPAPTSPSRARGAGEAAASAADSEPTTRLPPIPRSPAGRRDGATPEPAPAAVSASAGGSSPRATESPAAARPDEARPAIEPPVGDLQPTVPLDRAVSRQDGGLPTEEVEQDYDPEGYEQWPVPPPPIAWPYWFFGLTSVLAFLMMLFFLVVVASALL